MIVPWDVATVPTPEQTYNVSRVSPRVTCRKSPSFPLIYDHSLPLQALSPDLRRKVDANRQARLALQHGTQRQQSAQVRLFVVTYAHAAPDFPASNCVIQCSTAVADRPVHLCPAGGSRRGKTSLGRPAHQIPIKVGFRRRDPASAIPSCLSFRCRVSRHVACIVPLMDGLAPFLMDPLLERFMRLLYLYLLKVSASAVS